MGLCEDCRKDDHEHHKGKYPVKIGKKSQMGTTSRTADCECAKCVKHDAPAPEKEEPRVVVEVFPSRAYTDDPCKVCKDPSHWDKAPRGELANGLAPHFVAVRGEQLCLGCPRCVVVMDQILTTAVVL